MIVALLVGGVPWNLCAWIVIGAARVAFVVYERPLLRAGARLAADGPLLPWRVAAPGLEDRPIEPATPAS